MSVDRNPVQDSEGERRRRSSPGSAFADSLGEGWSAAPPRLAGFGRRVRLIEGAP
ncbi:hypothetical protein [Spongiactinospora rosea]|uniref:hypothetical protein n=1 Tax=Spongiactinospora rosea TaxID=2248750 RepID=UPI0013142F50|nr:hypothetical protein [Spongiactinospora rosea]